MSPSDLASPQTLAPLIRVVDLETTGLAPPEAAVCEIGWADVARDGAGRWSVAGTFVSHFVDPGQLIPAEASAIHHILDEDVVGAISWPNAITLLLDPSVVLLAAHNAVFERQWLTDEVVGDLRWLCSYKAALRMFPDCTSHSNQALRYILSLPTLRDVASPPHRAGPDAYVSAHLVAHLLNDGRASFEDMIRWSSGAALLPRINFGKHKGSRWDDVPVDYLDWVANKSDLDSDAKANARHHLKKRRVMA